MSANHLILGLGGTFGKVIRSFRTTTYQESRKENRRVEIRVKQQTRA